MKVVLVNCPLDWIADKTAADQPPMGLLYISEYAKSRRTNHSIMLLDPVARGLGVPETLDEIKASNCNLVGLNVVSPLFRVAVALVKEIKRLGIPVILGGPHATLLPCETIEQTGADIAVIGEGEVTFAEVLDCFNVGQFPEQVCGIAYQKGRKIIVTPPRPVNNDLDSLPFPHAVSSSSNDVGLPRKGYIVSSRGCPHECIFCSTPVICGRKWRYRSANNIIQEVELYKHKYGTTEIHFLDDNFTVHIARLKEFCATVRPLQIRWRALSRVGLSAEILKMMRDSGCYRLSFGVESGANDILTRIKKRISLSEAEKTIATCSSLGISAKVFFMLGFPFERIEHIARTINLAVEWTKRFSIDVAFNIVKPYPGSELARYVQHIDGFHLIQPDKSLSEEEMRLVKKFGDLPCPSINPFFSVRDLIGFVETAYRSCFNKETVSVSSLLSRRGIA